MSEKQYTSWDGVPLSLTVDEAANVLGVHSNTVRNVIKSGELAARKVGREWRIARENLRVYLEGKHITRRPGDIDEAEAMFKQHQQMKEAMRRDNPTED